MADAPGDLKTIHLYKRDKEVLTEKKEGKKKVQEQEYSIIIIKIMTQME